MAPPSEPGLDLPPRNTRAIDRIEAAIQTALAEPENARTALEGLAGVLESLRESAAVQRDNERQVDALSQIILGLARLEFPDAGQTDTFTGAFEVLAFGLFGLGEELQHGVVSRDYLGSIFGSISELLVVSDLDRVVRRVNPALIRIVGAEPGDLLLASVDGLYPAGVIHRVEQGLEAGDDSLFSGDTVLFLRDGTTVPVHLTATALRTRDGVTGVVYVAQDIRQRLAVDQELRVHRENLANLVRERTHELEVAQAELVRGARLAMLGQLTATVAHELRNPLGTIRNSVFLLDRLSADEPTLRRALDRCTRSIARCDRIIEELLDVTRVRSPSTKPITLDVWLRSLVVEVEVPDPVEVVLDFNLGERTAPLDPERLRRAMINVIDNACDAMVSPESSSGGRAPGGTLTISTAQANGRLEIRVADTGGGFGPDIRERIFEPLFSTKGFGVGLGMTIVKQICEEHGGGVELDSNEGHGTLVTLWIPLPA